MILRLSMSALLLGATVTAPSAAAPYSVERVAILMRHGVRPPTKEPAMPIGIAAQAWPSWNAKPGYLTSRGAIAVKRLGRADRQALSAQGLLPVAGCPLGGTVRLVSDSDQRTIATGDAWAAGFAPGCAIVNEHKPQDEPDPIFGAIEQGQVDYDPTLADAAVAAALPSGGITAVDAAERKHLARLNEILCGEARSTCGLPGATAIVQAKPRQRPKLSGAIDRGSTAAQILLLEYADGKPMAQVGWGRASAVDVEALGSLHAAEFAVLARPKYVAARNVAPIAKILRDGLAPLSRGQAKITIVVGHDTNVANLGGLLDLHWRVPGFAADDPAPGGAIMLSLLRNARGERFVQASYRAQSLSSIRALGSDTMTNTLDIPGCGRRVDRLCPAAQFYDLIEVASKLAR